MYATSQASAYGIGAIFTVILILGLGIFLHILIVNEFASIAEKKGHRRNRYWHLCFWLGIMGILAVIALPDMNTREAQKILAEKLDALKNALLSVPVAPDDELPPL